MTGDTVLDDLRECTVSVVLQVFPGVEGTDGPVWYLCEVDAPSSDPDAVLDFVYSEIAEAGVVRCRRLVLERQRRDDAFRRVKSVVETVLGPKIERIEISRLALRWPDEGNVL